MVCIPEKHYEDIWEGQCWTSKEFLRTGRHTDEKFPQSLVVVQTKCMFFDGVLFFATEPVHKIGHAGDIDPNDLLEKYELVYDHATHLGQTEADLQDLKTALQAIADSDTWDAGELRAQAELALKHLRL